MVTHSMTFKVTSLKVKVSQNEVPQSQDAWVPAKLYYICSPGYLNANYV